MKISVLFFLFTFVVTNSSIAGDNARGVAKLAATIAVSTAVANGVASQKLKTICTKPGGVGVWACPMAISTAVQAVMDTKAAKSANNTASQIDCQYSFCGAGGTGATGAEINPYGNQSGMSPAALERERVLDGVERNANQSLRDVGKLGYHANPDGSVSGPNGKNYKGSDFASPQAMAAAGFSSDQIDAAQAAMKDMQKDAKNKFAELSKIMANGMADAGATQTIRNKKFVGEEDGFDMSKYLAGLNGNRGPASAEPFAGLSKNMGQDSIGVQGDNIFKMINRQYDNQRNKKTFLPQ